MVKGRFICCTTVRDQATTCKAHAEVPEMVALIRAHLLSYPDDDYSERISRLLARVEGESNG